MNEWRVSIIVALLILCGAAPQTHSALSTKVILDWGSLAVYLPPDASVTRHRINFETDEYDVARRTDGQQLLRIVVGGGAYDLGRYSKICLNHKKAWRLSSLRGAEIIVGEPGVNAVSASYENLSAKDSMIADRIMESIRFRDGRAC